MENPITVNYMLDLCKKLSDSGNGDMILKCGDDIIHENELTINILAHELKFRGSIFNHPMTERVQRFLEDIEDAKTRFYNP